MAPRILDEQSLNAREQQIIDAAIGLIQEVGIEHLTMDKLVARVPFSKGTIYKHFLGKEDLMLAIGNQAIAILSDLFWRAAKFEGCARERMLLLNISYLIYAILHPVLFSAVICTKSQTVYGKSSDERIAEQEKLEEKLMSAIFSVFEDAIENKSLVIPSNMIIQQVCFSNWSMNYGTIALLSTEVEQCAGRTGLIVEREMFNQNNIFFDGLDWAPLTEDKDYNQALNSALQRVFPGELRLMKEMGREFNFNQ